MGGYLKEIIPLGVDKNKTGVLKGQVHDFGPLYLPIIIFRFRLPCWFFNETTTS